ncbi:MULTISPECIES: hypothetical protein [Bacillus cereus group]|uniref:hypothetical protein n=1 Tax=Bacillus cereus group TaxID=86661 RepID=UPI000D9720F4|nr:hypothetical protein [Bacillus cereus]MCU4948617.1 hypothetical protein [Bacillus cereus]SPT76126.1 pXO1-134 [Bacillus cereus]
MKHDIRNVITSYIILEDLDTYLTVAKREFNFGSEVDNTSMEDMIANWPELFNDYPKWYCHMR